MVIDFHTHCFPDKIAKRAIDSLSELSKKTPMFDGTAEGLRGFMKSNGIDKSVVCNIATNARQNTAVNDFAIALNSADLIAFGSIHPEFEDYKNEIDRLENAEIKGIKLHPDYQNYCVDDKGMMNVYEYALKKGFILIFHSGLDIGLRGIVHCTPDRFLNVVNAFSGEKIVLAHMGGYKYSEICEEYIIGKDFYFDTSASISFLAKEQSERMIKNHGADKVLFATDTPWFSAQTEFDYISSLNLSKEEKEKIYFKNAKRLLGI